MLDDEDPPCIDCALAKCRDCLNADPAPIGQRACCCGIEDEHDTWANPRPQRRR